MLSISEWEREVAEKFRSRMEKRIVQLHPGDHVYKSDNEIPPGLLIELNHKWGHGDLQTAKQILARGPNLRYAGVYHKLETANNITYEFGDTVKRKEIFADCFYGRYDQCYVKGGSGYGNGRGSGSIVTWRALKITRTNCPDIPSEDMRSTESMINMGFDISDVSNTNNYWHGKWLTFGLFRDDDGNHKLTPPCFALLKSLVENGLRPHQAGKKKTPNPKQRKEDLRFVAIAKDKDGLPKLVAPNWGDDLYRKLKMKAPGMS